MSLAATSTGPARTAAEPNLREKLGKHPATVYYLMWGSTILLLVLGLVMVWSASAIESLRDSGGTTDSLKKQLIFAVLGLAVLYGAQLLPPKAVSRLTIVALIVAFLGLIAVLIPGIGVRVSGQQNWIEFGSVRVQPSEVAKMAIIWWGADMLAKRRRKTMDWASMLIPLAPVVFAMLVLIALEGDFGNAMILALIAGGLLFIAGAPLRLFGAFGALFAAGVTYMSMTQEYRMRRWTSFLDSGADSLDGAWQVTQGMYAMGTGGWWGVGIGASREKWGSLPAAHTDFILAVIGEELGLIGTLTVLALFMCLIYAIIRLGKDTPDRFVALLAGGMSAWLIIQVITNVGAALKMLPITGVVLPMVSYGGSSLVPLLFGIGLLLGAAKRHSLSEHGVEQ